MTKPQFSEALNHLDEELIREAIEEDLHNTALKKRRILRGSLAAAAVLLIIFLIGIPFLFPSGSIEETGVIDPVAQEATITASEAFDRLNAGLYTGESVPELPEGYTVMEVELIYRTDPEGNRIPYYRFTVQFPVTQTAPEASGAAGNDGVSFAYYYVPAVKEP